ncbi:hypothetical protein M3Y94_00088800 [Aphelenchoides besseyi]|nr:hypothetical protein M3Y94_00088800 [Aphelenchoides besseyi]
MFNEVGVIVFHMFLGELLLPLRMGTPQQEFDALFDFATVQLVVSAEDCGTRRRDCPRMCNDEAIAHLYCDPLCFPINKAMHKAYCQYPFLSSNSTTYKRLNGTWKERLQCCNDPLYGRFASDIFQFGDSIKTPNFKLEFVEGTLMQERAFPYNDIIFGLGFRDSSGHAGVVEQLYQQKVIREPIITIASPLVVLGALDSQNCDSWSHFPVVSDALGWTFEVERVELFGITISSHVNDLQAPREVKQKLIELGIVVDCNHSSFFWCVCDVTKNTFCYTWS